MREIKFRIYDKQHKEWFYHFPQPFHFDWERFDVMQYTGLKDKNGKEIYEGDLFYIPKNFNASFGEIVFFNGAWQVTYENRFEYLSKYITDTAQPILTEEIISNIYESPRRIERAKR